MMHGVSPAKAAVLLAVGLGFGAVLCVACVEQRDRVSVYEFSAGLFERRREVWAGDDA